MSLKTPQDLLYMVWYIHAQKTIDEDQKTKGTLLMWNISTL